MSQWPASGRGESALRLFLSYAGVDRAHARTVAEALEATHGIELFRDGTDLGWGGNWQEVLDEVLFDCDAFLLLVGPGEVRDWTLAETSRALDRHFAARKGRERLLILPLLLPEAKPATLPPFLRLFPAEIWPAEFQLDEAQDVVTRWVVPRLRDRLEHRVAGPVLPAADLRQGDRPFQGLEAYGKGDARFFLGRQQDTAELLTRPGWTEGGRRRRWLQIEGESGSGKTSLIHAGLLPAIEQGWRGFGKDECAILPPMRPLGDVLHELATILHAGFSGLVTIDDIEQRLTTTGDETLASLLTALRLYKATEGRKQPVLLLVIDQFEELLTVQGDPRKTRLFDRLLANALKDESAGLYLITAVRSDLLDFHPLPELQRCLNERGTRYQLGWFNERQLREIIFGLPAVLGVEWGDPELPQEILSRALKESAPLSAVQFILRVLWEKREDGRLLRRHYDPRRGGSLSEALGAAADHLLQGPGGKHNALNLLLELTVERGDEGFARRPLAYPEAVKAAGGGRRGERIIRRLAGQQEADSTRLRLLTVRPDGQGRPGRVELIHEILLRKGIWPTLRKHLGQNRERHHLRQSLERRVSTWMQSRGPARWWTVLTMRGDLKKARRVAADNTEIASYLHRGRRVHRLINALAVLAALVVAVLVDTGYGLDRRGHDWRAGLSVAALWERIRFRGVWLRYRVRLWQGDFPVPALVTIPPGAFLMGSPTSFWENERPVREVTIDHGIQLGRYEITFEEYDFFANATDRALPDDGGWGRGRRPVINVNWQEAVEYGKWMSVRTGQVCRLPSEAEWEYAARAGSVGDYGLGREGREITADNLGDYAWYSANADRRTREVGTKRPNARGLHDMHGNVWEWTQDCWHDDYRNAPRDGSAWEAADGGDCGRRVLRGGAWFYGSNDLRAAFRNWSPPDARGTFIGFRVACIPHS